MRDDEPSGDKKKMEKGGNIFITVSSALVNKVLSPPPGRYLIVSFSCYCYSSPESVGGFGH